MKELSRNKSQEIAMQILASFLLQQSKNLVINVEGTFEDVLDMPYEDAPIFLKETIIKSLKYENKIIAYISKYLKDWKFDRLNICVQAILILAVTNYRYLEEKIDKKVVINVAVELAKKYSEENDYKFVNAILDNCLND